MSDAAPPSRLLSLDVFRGLTIAAMIVVNSPGNSTSYAPLDHAEWNGLTPTDLVFPFFVFIVGVSLVMSLAKRLERGDARGVLLRQVLKRTLIIFGIGVLLNGFPYYHLDVIRIPGVLQRIALCYFFGSLLYLYTGAIVQILLLLALLVGYWWLMTHLAVPGFATGDLSKEGNVAAYLDRLLLGKHLYRPVYDPEGLLSTLPAIGTVITGTLTGRLLRSRWAHGQKVTAMLQAGLLFVIIGAKWNEHFPFNKALWTSSYVFFTSGLALVLLGIISWLIDLRGWRGWSKPFEIFGLNALAAYVLHVFFLKCQNLWKVAGPDGAPVSIRIAFTNAVFGHWLSPEAASLSYALLYTLIWLAVLTVLYRRGLILKV